MAATLGSIAWHPTGREPVSVLGPDYPLHLDPDCAPGFPTSMMLPLAQLAGACGGCASVGVDLAGLARSPDRCGQAVLFGASLEALLLHPSLRLLMQACALPGARPHAHTRGDAWLLVLCPRVGEAVREHVDAGTAQLVGLAATTPAPAAWLATLGALWHPGGDDRPYRRLDQAVAAADAVLARRDS